MAKPRITIIGLGVIGSSIGAALQREPNNVEIVGHDKDPKQAGEAKQRGHVHKTAWNLHRACDGAELVITAVPQGELPELYSQIAEDLKPGSLVFSLVDVMQPALAAAESNLPGHVGFAMGHPIITGLSGPVEPSANLFENSVFCLAASVNTAPNAVELAHNLIGRVGAEPFFIDVQEHDGVVALIEQLPQLIASALMNLSTSLPGWRESKRLAGRQFAQTTDVHRSGEALASAFQANRENLLLRLTQFEEELQKWHQLLAESNEEELAETLKSSLIERIRWETEASVQEWQEDKLSTGSVEENQSGLLRQMFLGNLFQSRRRGTDDKP
jgi:prephenate dehydrogenase